MKLADEKAAVLIEEIQLLLKQNDPASRKQASVLSKVLTTTLEIPEDMAVQLSFMVRIDTSNQFW
jgi:hypothetical protein